MRIAHVISSLNPGGGGLPKSAAAMASALAAQGEKCALIFLSAPGDSEKIEKAYGAFPGFDKIRIFPIPKCPWSMLSRAPISRALHEFAPDIVHTHGLWEPLLARALQFAGQNKIPAVISAHSMLHPWHSAHHRFSKCCLKYVLGWKKQWRQAAFVHVLNEAEAGDWRKQGVDRTRLIPNGIFADEDLGSGAVALPELSGADFLLSLARLHSQKAPDLLMQAFALVQERYPDLHLVLAGPDYGMGKELRRLAVALGCEGRVHFPGELKGERKWGALHQCSGFCLPSRAEGFSLSLLEAALAGAPIVMSENCYFDELAEAGGALLSGLEPGVLAENIIRVLNAGTSMGEAARTLVLSEYTWEILVGEFVDAYRMSLAPEGLK